MITLNTGMFNEPELTAATVIHHAVGDLLFQSKFGYAHFPELVDLATIQVGLGMLLSSFSFVKQTGSYWDSTLWDVSPRPFLDAQPVAYANAVAAWVRGQKGSEWADSLTADVKRPMRKSLKFLNKTGDSFFQPATAGQRRLQQPQLDWLRAASEPSVSMQIVAIRQMKSDETLRAQQVALLVDKLRSNQNAIVLHSISAVEDLKLNDEAIAEELRVLVENRDDETRAKAIVALTKLAKLDEATIAVAAKMVDSRIKFIVFAGMFALSSLESVTPPVLKAAERGFVRSLQTCDYEFVGLFAAAFTRWLEAPEDHVRQLLEDDEPEYLEIALEALETVGQNTVALN